MIKNKTYQNMWDAVKAILKGKFTALNTQIRKDEKCQINDLNSHLKKLEKEQELHHKNNKAKKPRKMDQ